MFMKYCKCGNLRPTFFKECDDCRAEASKKRLMESTFSYGEKVAVSLETDNIRKLKPLSPTSTSSNSQSSSSHVPYSITEIDNIIKNFHKKFPGCMGKEEHQTNLNNKLLYIVRDLLIRIEKLEKRKRR